jgi:cytochrome c-type biogenesis protein
LPFLHTTARLEVAKPVGLWGAYAMGLAFAFGWTPCIGPVLAAVLSVAATESTVAKGAGLLAVYSLGLGIPFVLAAFAIGPFVKALARMRSKLHVVEKVMGGLLVLTGIAFLMGWVTQASFWLLESFPVLQQFG